MRVALDTNRYTDLARGLEPTVSLVASADAVFVPFIVLLFSLYTISGGIRIACDLEARPTTNAAFMAIGAVHAASR